MIKLSEFGSRSILTVLLALSIGSTNVWAHSERKSSPKAPTELETAGFAIQPPTLAAATATRVSIALTLADAGQRFADNRLVIERRFYLPNGAEVFKPIGYLSTGCGKADKHRNQRNCDSRGDTVFSGVIDVEPTVTGVLMLRAGGYEINSRRFLATSPVSIPVALACGPTATILPIRIAEAEPANNQRRKHHHHHSGSASRPYQLFDFDVPQAGTGVLRLVNGGSLGAAFSERFEAAVIELNGRAIKHVNKHDNVAELSVDLREGANQLKVVELAGRLGQRLSARIDACADNVELKPVGDSLRIGDVLPVQAAVSGLGMPVDGADVMFGLPGLAESESAAATTTSSGIAGAEFKLVSAGEGELQVAVAGANPPLNDARPLRVLAQPSLLLNQGRDQITLAVGESIQQPYFLFHTAAVGAPIHVRFTQRIEPATDGLTTATPSVPVEGYPFAGPGSVSFESTIQALAAGEYKLVATAIIAETQETFSVETAVSVVDASAPKPLNLGAPSLTPAGVAPNTSSPVKIAALAGGTDTPPASLLVDEVDDQDRVVASAIAVLRDDGTGADAVAGDMIYSGNAVFNRAAADLRLRVRADYFGAEVASLATLFSVTPFALQGPPADSSSLIPGNDGQARVYGNEILLTLLPDTAPSRVTAIAGALNGQVLSVIPSLQLYRLQIAGDGSLQTLQNAIAKALEFAEVVRATPNSEVTFAGSVCGNAGDGYCPSDPRLADQWYLDTIKAKQAWAALRSVDPANLAGSVNYQVAVIDNGVKCNHRDLTGQCVVDDGSVDGSHATQVAGIIAAGAENNTDIAGIAWNSRINAYALTGYDLNSVLTALDAARAGGAKVINMSFTTDALTSGQAETLRAAACTVANAGKLMVAAAGNVAAGAAVGIEKFPAKLNDSSFSCGNTPLSSYMLTVGGSNESDALATWSALKSNTATWVDLYAPATNIVSTDGNNGYSSASGTSFAAPQVAAAAAVLWNSMPAGTTVTQVHDRLLRSADTVAGLGKRLNLFAAVVPVRLNINFQFEDAAFQNLFGIYDKVSRKARILIDNVDLETNPSLSAFSTSILLTDAGYANLEYFMIPNGAQINAAYLSSMPAANRNLEVFRATDGKWRLRDANGTVLAGQAGEADALFSDPALNPDVGRAQVQKVPVSSADDFELRWEDRPAAFSDNDYNDAIFRIVKQGN